RPWSLSAFGLSFPPCLPLWVDGLRRLNLIFTPSCPNLQDKDAAGQSQGYGIPPYILPHRSRPIFSTHLRQPLKPRGARADTSFRNHGKETLVSDVSKAFAGSDAQEVARALAVLRGLLSSVTSPVVRTCLEQAQEDIAHLTSRNDCTP